ncbi:MAG: hypothetical protein J1E05_06940 [Eubacterium sp.]|nr:hypothetical protein [Eubacterium sp.]
MEPYLIVIIIVAVILLGVIILPLFNRRQFRKLPVDQQVLAIMKQAKTLIFFKNVSNGRTGNLFYVKNKRKILVYPWALDENGKMVIVKKNPFDNWNYPEEKAPLSEDEIKQAREELYKYSEKSIVKLTFNDPFKENEAKPEP